MEEEKAKETTEIGEKAVKEEKTEKKRKLKKDEKISELTNLLQHVQADFENYRKRVEQDREKLIKHANKELIAALLPIVDSFELALKNKKENGEFTKGIELIYAQFHDVLEKEGLRRIEAQRFDPCMHEALMQLASEAEDGVILEELQKGYMLHDCVIRPTRVIISKKQVKNETNKNS